MKIQGGEARPLPLLQMPMVRQGVTGGKLTLRPEKRSLLCLLVEAVWQISKQNCKTFSSNLEIDRINGK